MHRWDIDATSPPISRSLSERNRRLNATVAWRYQLLTPDERPPSVARGAHAPP